MENLALRKAVAKALGCKPEMVDFGFGRILPCCYCLDAKHVGELSRALPPYELDDAAALAALKEFCVGKMSFNFNYSKIHDDYFVEIYGVNENGLISEYSGRKSSLALAICEAIKSAAEGR